MRKTSEEAFQRSMEEEVMRRIYFIYYWRKIKNERVAKIGLISLFFLWTYILFYDLSVINILENTLNNDPRKFLDFFVSSFLNSDLSFKIGALVTAVFISVFYQYVMRTIKGLFNESKFALGRIILFPIKLKSSTTK